MSRDSAIAQASAALTAAGIAFTVATHAAVMNIEELQKVAQEPWGKLAKNLFVKDKKGQNLLIVVSENRKVNLKAVGKALGIAGDIRLDQKGLETTLGVTAGSVTPLAVLNDSKHSVHIVLDQTLDIGTGLVAVHPLTNEATVSLSANDLKAFIQAQGNKLTVLNMDEEETAPPPAAAAAKAPKAAAPKKAPKEAAPALSGGDAKTKNQDGITATKSGNFSLWYQQVVVRSGMIDYYPISGCYIFRPWSFRIWEFITAYFDAEIKKLGVQNAYFPLFVTKKALCAEEAHVEGFAPECAWVTHSGDSKLPDPIAIRPTSETIMYPAYAKWIRSHRDLPLKLNQWTNVVRWEFSNPTPFIRSREFLWQEGHSAFATREEAEVEVLQILNLYASVYEKLLAMPVTKGKKTEREKFAGGLFTTTVEAFIPETGRGIQGATSHCLGQNFAKMFDITFLDESNQKQMVWQNSWGLSTRSIGAMIMCHGDDKGLVLPPPIAPVQIVIVPIFMGKDNEPIIAKCNELVEYFKTINVRAQADLSTEHNPGWKFFHWEQKGVPLRLEVGPRDLSSQQVQCVRRDTGVKWNLPWADLHTIPDIFTTIHTDMYNRALAKNAERLKTVHTWEEFITAVNSKCRALAPWCGSEPCENKIKARSQAEAVIEEVQLDAADLSEEAKMVSGEKLSGAAKSLCVPLRQPVMNPGTLCVNCGAPAVNYTMFGRSY